MKITVLTIVTLDTPLLHDIQTTGGRKLFIEHFNMSPYRRLVNPPVNLHLGFKCVQFSLGKIFTSSYSESWVILDKLWQRWQKTALSNSVTPCHLHLLLSVLFSETRIEKNCYSFIQEARARFKKLKPKQPSKYAFLLPFWTAKHLSPWKAMTPDGMKVNKTNLGGLLDHGMVFRCPLHLTELNC